MDFLNAIILLLNYIFIPALTYGSQLALGAIFVTLIYGILRFANFATGDMMSFGTMVTILFTWYFHSIGISLGVFPTALIAIPFAILFMIIYMLFIDKFVFKYYRVNKSPPVQLAMVSIGVMFVTQAVVRIIIGPSDRRFFDGERFIIKAREFKEMTGLNEGLALKSTQVITIFVTIVLVSLLFWFLNKTKTGKSMKAYSDNEDLALLSGIDPKKIVMITWIIAGILATIGGAPPIVAKIPAIIQVIITIFFGSIPESNARSSLSEYAFMLFPVLVLLRNQNKRETNTIVTNIVITCVDFNARPSFSPVISLNSRALIINLSPSKNLLSDGPIIILTTA